jgi:hypothetical protein
MLLCVLKTAFVFNDFSKGFLRGALAQRKKHRLKASNQKKTPDRIERFNL